MNIEVENFEFYSIITPKDIPSDNATALLHEVEKILFQKHQHIVLSLVHIESLFSVQLSSIIQVYKVLQQFQLKLILCDLSYGVVNVLEMTQMNNLMDLYITREDFEVESIHLTLSEKIPDLEFSISVQKTSTEVICSLSGFMSMSADVDMIKSIIEEDLKPVLDLSKLGFIDRSALIFLAELTRVKKITIRSSSSLIEELLEEEGVAALFEIEESDY